MNNIKLKIEKYIDFNRFLSFLKLFFIIIFFIYFIGIFAKTFAKYESSASTTAEASIAFYVVDVGKTTQSLSLGQIEPSSTPYVYSFFVSNNKNSHRAEVNLEYEIYFVTTTNLPVTYRLYKNQNYNDNGAVDIISTSNNYQDEDLTILKKMEINQTGSFSYTQNQTDVYNLVVDFPTSYSNSYDSYAGVMEMVSVVVKAHQIV